MNVKSFKEQAPVSAGMTVFGYSELMDKNIELLARRAKAWSFVNIEKLAGQNIALQAKSDNQWNWFDEGTGTFKNL